MISNFGMFAVKMQKRSVRGTTFEMENRYREISAYTRASIRCQEACSTIMADLREKAAVRFIEKR